MRASLTHSLTDADISVAKVMGNDLKAGAQMKYRHGAGGLAGVALFANAPGSEPFPGKRQSSPFPDSPGWKPLKGGEETDELLRKKIAVAPADSDDENPRTVLYDPVDDTYPDEGMSVRFPDGSTSISKRKKKEAK
jgi:hypothetical protein